MPHGCCINHTTDVFSRARINKLHLNHIAIWTRFMLSATGLVYLASELPDNWYNIYNRVNLISDYFRPVLLFFYFTLFILTKTNARGTDLVWCQAHPAPARSLPRSPTDTTCWPAPLGLRPKPSTVEKEALFPPWAGKTAAALPEQPMSASCPPGHVASSRSSDSFPSLASGSPWVHLICLLRMFCWNSRQKPQLFCHLWWTDLHSDPGDLSRFTHGGRNWAHRRPNVSFLSAAAGQSSSLSPVSLYPSGFTRKWAQYSEG